MNSIRLFWRDSLSKLFRPFQALLDFFQTIIQVDNDNLLNELQRLINVNRLTYERMLQVTNFKY